MLQALVLNNTIGAFLEHSENSIMSQRRSCVIISLLFVRFRSISRSSVNAQEITESDIRSYEGKLNKMSASRVTVECPLTHPFPRRSKGTASLRGR